MGQKEVGSHGFGEVLLGRYIRDNQIKPQMTAVALSILSRINWETNCSWPPATTISEEAGVSAATVKKIVKELIDRGVLVAKYRSSGKIATYYIGPALAAYYPGANVSIVSEDKPRRATASRESIIARNQLIPFFKKLASEKGIKALIKTRDFSALTNLIKKMTVEEILALMQTFVDDRPKGRDGLPVTMTLCAMSGFAQSIIERREYRDTLKKFQEHPEIVQRAIEWGRK